MARVMDFVHDDSGSHVARTAKQSAAPDDDEIDDLLSDVQEGPEDQPYEDEDAEPEPDEESEGQEESEEPEEEKPEPKAAKRKDHLKGEMDRLVAESQRSAALEARLREQERRAQLADLNSIKSHAALRAFEFETVKRQLDEAIELGEVSRQSELRDKYHDLRTEMQQAAAFIQRQEQVLSQPQAAPQPQQPPPNPRAVAWTKKQSWWGTDDALTAVALIIDEKLIKEGVNPYTDGFYKQLEKRLAPYMPRSGRRRQAVAGVSTRSAPSASGRKVRLDSDQLEMARRLNVPPAEYAKYVGM
jgi:hypothetical protein